MIVDNNFYNDVGTSLERLYSGDNKKNHKYFYQQRYFSQAVQNPLAPVTPLYTEFWGPKVMTLMIYGRNYGWTDGSFNWPPDGFEASKTKIKENFSNWIQYKVLVWVDYVLSNKIMESSPDSDYADQMAQTQDEIEAMCAELGDFGFEFKGTLTEGKEASFFKPYIDEFYDQ